MITQHLNNVYQLKTFETKYVVNNINDSMINQLKVNILKLITWKPLNHNNATFKHNLPTKNI